MKPYEKFDALVERIVFILSTEKMLLDETQLQNEAALKLRAERDEKTRLEAEETMQEAFILFLNELRETYGSHLSKDQHLEIVRRTNKTAEKGSRKSFEETYTLYAALLESDPEN